MKDQFKIIKKSWKYIKPYQKMVGYYLFVGLIFSIISLVPPFLMASMIAEISNNHVKQLFLLAIALFSFEVMGHLTSYLWNYLYVKIGNIYIMEIKKNLSLAITNLEVKNFDQNSSGIFIKRMDDDPGKIISFFDYVSLATTEIITNAGVFIFLFKLNFQMALLMLLLFFPIYLLQKKRVKERMKSMKEWRDIDDNNQTIMNEMLRGVRDIKVLNLKEQFSKYLIDHFEKYTEKSIYLETRNQLFWTYDRIIKSLIGLIIIGFGAFLMGNTGLLPTVLITVYLYKGSLFSLVDRISNVFGQYKEFELSANRIFEIAEYTGFTKEQFGTKKIKITKGTIEFKDIVFGYDEKLVINGLNLAIESNDTIAIVGRSGGGKSTLFSLLSKMYNVQSGDIVIDGVPINELSEDSIRNGISYITQNPYIFNMSVRDNLKLVKKDLTDEEMIEKCKLAAIHDFIMTLSNRYDTVLGEGGITLSGGQRQRLAIARALIKDSKIILFDEATSALDNETQKEIQQSINNITDDYTILIIAHRLSTITSCKKIIVMDQGKIVGIGTHDELLKSNSYYQELYQGNLE